jgi:hypothetical protein
MAIGLGADFQMSTDGGATYATMGKIVDVLDAPEADVEDKDASYLQQPDASKRFIAALIDEGEAKFKIYWDAAKYSAARAQLRKPNNFKTIWNDQVSATNSIQVFAGYIKKLGNSVPLKDHLITNVAVKVSGQPTFTPAT